MGKRFTFPHVGTRGRQRIFLLLVALSCCEGALGLALIALAARPLSTVTHHLSGLNLFFPTILKAQLYYGLFVAFISLIGIRVTSHCIYSFDISSVKRAHIAWSCVGVTLIVLTAVKAVFLPQVMSLGTQEVVDTLGRGLNQYLLDGSWKSRLDGMQHELKCCGISDQEDWLKGKWIPLESLKQSAFNQDFLAVNGHIKKPVLPASCCSPDYDLPCVHDFLQQGKMSHQTDMNLFFEGVYTSGCVGPLLDPIISSVTSYSVIAVLICIFQVCELIISNVLYFICNRKSC